MFDYLYNYFMTSSLGQLELIGSILILLCVWQVSQQNIWNFWTGAIGCAIFGYIFMETKLYADMTLQWLYFLPMSFYGYWYWMTKGPQRDTLNVQQGTIDQQFIGATLLLVGTVSVGYLYDTFTDAALPYPDSFILVASIYGQYLLSKKYVESWVLWVLVDMVAVPTYAAKGLYVTSGLYVILFVLASYGLYKWVCEYMDSKEVVWERQ